MRLSLSLVALATALSATAAGPYDGWQPHRYCNDLDAIDATRVPPLTPEQADRVESLEQVQVRPVDAISLRVGWRRSAQD